MLERQFIGSMIKNALWDGDVFRESTVLAVIFAGYSQHAAIIAEVYLAAPTVLTLAAINRGIERDPVPRRPISHLLAETFNHA